MNWQIVLKRPITRLFAIFCVIGRFNYDTKKRCWQWYFFQLYTPCITIKQTKQNGSFLYKHSRL